MQLLLPQENEINIQTKIKEINQTNKILQKEENKKVQQHNQNSEKQLKEESTKPQFQQNFQDNNSHKKLFGSLQKEIQQLKIKSQNFTIIKQLLNLKEKQIQCIEYQYNDIYNVVNDVQQNQNIVMASESCFNEYIYRRRYQFYQIFQIQKKSKEQEL
ncbi:unnamed protein product [Paramecium pentaurelia]|uniref:Uncharacterized protein n=1 Tax=Paramecium pentaurelia TaxID=43138 RepID=A0A8S1UEW5_9CILI|nr:unnamed protein product [Paramecium pentaurelia]